MMADRCHSSDNRCGRDSRPQRSGNSTEKQLPLNNQALIQCLLERRIISSADVVDHGVQVVQEQRERFNIGRLYVAQQPVALIKRARNIQAVTSLRNEVSVCRWLNHQLAEMPAPQLLLAPNNPGVAVFEFVDPVNHQPAPLMSGYHAENLASLAKCLYRLHHAVKPADDQCLPQQRPWILSIFSAEGNDYHATIKQLLPEQRQRQLFRDCLQQVNADWHDNSLLHGDLKVEHCFLEQSSSIPRIRLIDWELGGIGDNAWDIAGVINELILEQHAAVSGSADNFRCLFESSRMLFLRDYCDDQAGLDQINRRVSAFIVAKLLQTAIELTIGSDQLQLDNAIALLNDTYNYWRDHSNSAGIPQRIQQWA